jgi:hypothetical protein
MHPETVLYPSLNIPQCFNWTRKINIKALSLERAISFTEPTTDSKANLIQKHPVRDIQK